MWRLIANIQRERKHLTEGLLKKPRLSYAKSTNKVSLSTNQRFKHDVAFQLDYYMSPQFAGVASALVNNTYTDKGLKIDFLSTCPVGLEQQRVRDHQDANQSGVTMGSVEQNIFVPTLSSSPHLKTTAVAAMFRQSPLCVASMPRSDDDHSKKMIIGVHEDTVDIMRRIFPQHNIVASPRATKI